MNENIVIDAKWYAERVSRHQEWIEHTKEQIKWHEEMIALNVEQLKTEEGWLEEAIQDQKDFEIQKEPN